MWTTSSIDQLTTRKSKHQRSRSLCQNEFNSIASPSKPQSSLARCSSSRKLMSTDSVYENVYGYIRPVNGKQASPKPSSLSLLLGKENQSCANSVRDKQSPDKKILRIMTPMKKLVKNESTDKSLDPLKLESRLADCERTQESSLETTENNRLFEADSMPNKLSEDIVKCLSSIFLRVSTLKDKDGQSEFWDPYDLCSEFKTRDIGPYKNLCTIEAYSIDLSRTTNTFFLVNRLKLLLGKLASVKLEGLSQQ